VNDVVAMPQAAKVSAACSIATSLFRINEITPK